GNIQVARRIGCHAARVGREAGCGDGVFEGGAAEDGGAADGGAVDDCGALADAEDGNGGAVVGAQAVDDNLDRAGSQPGCARGEGDVHGAGGAGGDLAGAVAAVGWVKSRPEAPWVTTLMERMLES